MRSSCVQTLNEGGNTSTSATAAECCGIDNQNNIVIGNLSSKDFSEEDKKVFDLKKLKHRKNNPTTLSLEEANRVSIENDEERLKYNVHNSDSLGRYNSKFSPIKDSEGTHFSGEKLIEEIEVDSVLDLKLDEQNDYDIYEGKSLFTKSLSSYFFFVSF